MKWKLKEQYNKSVRQSWFFEKISKIDKPVAKQTKRQK
jgi:hypothetical protein